MEKNNFELFVQALNEGLSNRIDRTINECNVEIKPSKQHMLAMRTIVYGKGYRSEPLSPKARKIIAILIAAALLLTSCAVIYRNEIRNFIEEVTESFTRLSHSDEATEGSRIEEYYEFTYVPDGYIFERKITDPLVNRIFYSDAKNNTLVLTQGILDNHTIIVDEKNDAKILEVNTYDIYYKMSNDQHFYLWSDGKYALSIESDTYLSNKEILSIIGGIKD